jgi:hypothetical protein
MAKGRGTVYMRAGQWVIGFTVNGTRVRETIGPNKHFAEMVLKKRMTEAMENRYFSKRNLGRMPFRDFAGLYLERAVPMMKSARSEGSGCCGG